MSLQVWLPLNGDLHNQGLSNVTVTNSGATIDNNGKIGKCYKFDGTDDRITLSNLPQPQNISVAIWFKRNANTGTRQFLFTAWGGITLELATDGTITCSVMSNGSQTGICHPSSPIITTSTGWTHIVFTFQNGVGTKLYINGQLLTTTTLTTPIQWQTTTGNIGYFSTYFNGYINDFRIYDHALSPKEVEKIAKGLVLHYKLNDKFCEPTKNLLSAANSFPQPSNAGFSSSNTVFGQYFYINSNKLSTYTASVYLNNTSNLPICLCIRAKKASDGNYVNVKDSETLAPGQKKWLTVTLEVTSTYLTTGLGVGLVCSSPQNNLTSLPIVQYLQLEENNHATAWVLGGTQRGAQYDKIIYQEPDGTQWLRIAHHNNPSSSGYFTQSSTWEQGVYVDADKWYDAEGVIPQISKYEFMVKQKTTSDATETKYRWVQYKDPLIATWDDVKPGTVTINTSSGYTSSSFGGLWKKNSHARLCIANATSSNWYGAFGCWTTYGTSTVPGYPNTTISTGYFDLYVNVTGLDFSTEYDGSGYSNNGAIIGSLTAAAGSPRYGVATVFNGTNSAIKVTDNNWLSQGMEAMTINLWAKASSWDTNIRLFSCTEGGGFNTEDGNSGYLRFQINVYTAADKSSHAYKSDGSSLQKSALSTTDWVMLTFVYDSTGTKTYINGELHHTQTNTSYGIYFNLNARLFLGCEANVANPGAPYFNGQQSDFRIYATALTAAQVADLYRRSMIVDASGNISPRGLS